MITTSRNAELENILRLDHVKIGSPSWTKVVLPKGIFAGVSTSHEGVYQLVQNENIQVTINSNVSLEKDNTRLNFDNVLFIRISKIRVRIKMPRLFLLQRI